jgi:signal peptidase I
MTNQKVPRPSLEDLDRELASRSKARSRRRAVSGTVWVLIVVAAAAILCSSLFLSVLKVQGDSMEPTLHSGEILLAVKKTGFRSGDVIAFYYDNKILLKRVIAEPGDQVDVGEDGTVTVNGTPLDEPYLQSKSRGICDVQFPEQVPDGRIFVLGDNRKVSVDSRTAAIGCISEKAVAGKVILRIWPFGRLGAI